MNEYNWNSLKIEKDEDFTMPCTCPEHNPPTHIYIPVGHKLVHECPSCGKKVVLRPAFIIC